MLTIEICDRAQSSSHSAPTATSAASTATSTMHTDYFALVCSNIRLTSEEEGLLIGSNVLTLSILIKKQIATTQPGMEECDGGRQGGKTEKKQRQKFRD